MRAFYMGIDGGGTNSRLAVADEAGNILGRYTGLSTNISSNTASVVMEHIHSLIQQYIFESGDLLGNCKGFCIGSAGVDVAENVEEMHALLRGLGLDCPLFVINDGELILWAEMKDQEGVVINSGTGSIGFGKNCAGEVARVGGWGHVLGDEGSGYWIGCEAVRMALWAADGRNQHSVLNELICKHYQIARIEDILPIVYDTDFNKARLAALSREVETGAAQGDALSISILQSAAQHLMQMTKALQSRLSLKDGFTVTISGGTIENGQFLRQCFQNELYTLDNDIKICSAQQEPVMGAVYLARTNFMSDATLVMNHKC